VAVAGTMLTTTILLFYLVTRRWHWRLFAAVPVIAAFGAVDGAFLVANSFKIVEGGWFPLTVGGVIAFLMWCWRVGTSQLRLRLHEMSVPLAQFLQLLDEQKIARPAGTGVWLTKVAYRISPMLLHHIRHNAVLHQTVVLLTVEAARRPRVPFAERHSIERLGHGIYHITVRLGFMQRPNIPLTLENCEMLGFDADLHNVHYFIGHETVIRRGIGSKMGPVTFAVFAFLTRIAGRAPDFFHIPQDGLSEVGFRVEI
jgi:KUP system potassium uptake protein